MSTSIELEEELYCAICADLFEEPLMLPCTHSFCKKCLEERLEKGTVTRKSSFVMFDCPVCRKQITLDDDGLDDLPRNRLLKKMVDMYKVNVKKNKTNLIPKSLNELVERCRDHKKELGACCSLCNELVCIDCIVGDHSGHAFESIDDVYNRIRKSLVKRKDDLEDELIKLRNAKADEMKYLKQLKDNCQKKCEEIKVQFNECIDMIKQSRRSVLAEIAAREQQEVADVGKTIEVIKAKENELNQIVSNLTESLSMDKMNTLQTTKRQEKNILATERLNCMSSTAMEGTLSQPLKSQRTHCFIDCTLFLDTAAVATVANNAHLIWEPSVDMYSVKHLAERFKDLFEKEWKCAYSELTAKSKEDAVVNLMHTLSEAYSSATQCCETHLEAVTYHILQPDIDARVGDFNIYGINTTQNDSIDLTTFNSIKEVLRKLRAQQTSFVQEIVFMVNQEMNEPIIPLQREHKTCRPVADYANKCFEVCFMFRLQDPPLYVDFKGKPDTHPERIKDVYQCIKRKGRKSACLAWPPLYLYESGPLISKGILFVPV